MEPEELSRELGKILGSRPFTMDERDRINEATADVDSMDELPADIKALLERPLPDYRKPGGSERRASRLSTVERRIIKDSDKCPQCVANNDPRNVPVHPNCHCDVITDSIEAGVADNENRFFDALSLDMEDIEIIVNGDWPEGAALQLDPATAAILDSENARWADLERWLTQMQPYLESGERYLSIVVDDDTDEALAEAEEALATIAEDSEQLVEALTSRKLWFAIGQAVVL